MLNCKEEPKTIQEASPKEVTEPELVINLEFRTNKEDEVLFVFDEIVIDEFQKKSITISEKVIPTTTSENIIAKFGPGNAPGKLIIDLGSSELKEFEIVSMTFSYGDKAVTIDNNNLETYLALSKFSVFDKSTNKITTQKVDGYHFPKLYIRALLWEQLSK